jgi:hypothetical protein
MVGVLVFETFVPEKCNARVMETVADVGGVTRKTLSPTKPSSLFCDSQLDCLESPEVWNLRPRV